MNLISVAMFALTVNVDGNSRQARVNGRSDCVGVLCCAVLWRGVVLCVPCAVVLLWCVLWCGVPVWCGVCGVVWVVLVVVLVVLVVLVLVLVFGGVVLVVLVLVLVVLLVVVFRSACFTQGS